MNFLTGRKSSKCRILISLFKKYSMSSSKGVLIRDNELYHFIKNNQVITFEMTKKMKSNISGWSTKVDGTIVFIPDEKTVVGVRRTKPFEYKIKEGYKILING